MKNEFTKYFRLKYLLILLILLSVSVVWSKFVIIAAFIAVFGPITFMTVRYSKIVPHISIESNTAMSCFIDLWEINVIDVNISPRHANQVKTRFV